MSVISRRRRVLKQDARSALYTHYLPVLLASLMVTTIVFGSFMLLMTYRELVSVVIPKTILAPLFLCVLLFLALLYSPLLFGYASYIAELYDTGSAPPLSELFRYYSSFRRFFWALRISVAYGIVFLGAFALLYVIGNVDRILPKNDAENAAVFLSETVFGLLVLIVFFVLARFLTGWLLTAKLIERGEANGILAGAKKSRLNMRGHKWEFFVYTLSFLAVFALSLLTFGVLFVAFAMPYYQLSLTAFTSYVIATNRRPAVLDPGQIMPSTGHNDMTTQTTEPMIGEAPNPPEELSPDASESES